ncbi:type VI secretion system baseplate subunit TssE [Rhodopila globiformis]|nr:type VI secretion system baseplate subunit TssE [Rhodopila globiformis]
MSRRPGMDPRNQSLRFQAPLLDRLIDLNPGQRSDGVSFPGDSLTALRNAVRRDLEALLNARRRWRSWPASLRHLAVSPIGYGLPDFSAGAFNDPRQREELRFEVEDTIRRFEPRFLSLTVSLQNADAPLDSALRLRIDAVLHADPAPEPISFDTFVDPSADEVIVVARDAP